MAAATIGGTFLDPRAQPCLMSFEMPCKCLGDFVGDLRAAKKSLVAEFATRLIIMSMNRIVFSDQ
jgi:hypothetical protein